MGKLKERFHRKNGIVSRIFSMVLALAMIMTMIPAIGGATTAYAASPTIRLYLDKPSTWNTPVVNVWASGATVNNHDAGNATISQWGDQEKPKLVIVVEAQRLVDPDARVQLETALFQTVLASGMAGIQDGHIVLLCQCVDSSEQTQEVLFRVDVLLTVGGQQNVLVLLQSQTL